MDDYTSVFMSCARKLDGDIIGINVDENTNRGGLNVNKGFLRDNHIIDRCLDLARTYLGKDVIDNMFDDRYIRSFIIDTFGSDRDLFVGSDGRFNLGIENTLLLYYKLKMKRPDLVNTLVGLRALITARVLKKEFESLFKATNKGVIAPIYRLNSQFFGWQRAQEILRKYTLYLTKPEGYTCYYYERPNLAQITFLCACGKSLQEATTYVDNMHSGLFYDFLSKDTEELLMPAILSGKTGMLNSKYTDKLNTFESNLFDKYDSELYTVYNILVKPNMIELTGNCIDTILKEIKESNPELSNWDAFVYHLSPQRFGLAIKNDVHIEDVLPKSHMLFKKVVKPLYTDILKGLYL